MSTINRRKRLPQRERFTPKVLELFRKILAAEFWSEEYHKLDRELHHELKLKLWEGCPVVISPDIELDASLAGDNWCPDAGPKLYRELRAAAGIADAGAG